MKYAIRKLDDSEFRNAFSKSYIRYGNMIPSEACQEAADIAVAVLMGKSPAVIEVTVIAGAVAEASLLSLNLHVDPIPNLDHDLFPLILVLVLIQGQKILYQDMIFCLLPCPLLANLVSSS